MRELRYDHIGIPTNKPLPAEDYSAKYKLYASGLWLRKVKGFVKSHYPLPLGARQNRGPVGTAFNWLHLVVVWLLFSPVALVLQALSERDASWKVAGP